MSHHTNNVRQSKLVLCSTAMAASHAVLYAGNLPLVKCHHDSMLYGINLMLAEQKALNIQELGVVQHAVVVALHTL